MDEVHKQDNLQNVIKSQLFLNIKNNTEIKNYMYIYIIMK